MKTFIQKPADVTRRWILIDATSAPLGRVATEVAKYLIGKYKPTYTPHVDGGDYVIVINAKDTVVTGEKETDKIYYRHSGFPGGIKDAQLKEVREKFPERIIENAVRGMLPKNKLSPERMARLRVFSGSEHTHEAQKPEKVEVR
ncbi:ribosomal protein L13 [Candidatus Saccharimonas aalborgensis]|jgi:large subunit ribosomal protein L13|uniref:Large ribosomal subunit protein uL13 n=1 Tax=Candidatus Saccharimonas aalborgensis TaxID=1332188 RepID=R4PY46_9BACT|nr:50S ribosomal protein L13 [Candidatus Saccharimonas aalborgensis]AGL62692.1 ribosomal protein L13 [Candidatus Saccharimonas aalborgensis]QQR51461.1 MAG: 50S ribosomal protein L13 [Candidatus Saccharibacteria bacterium]QQS68191.1 MAG: 50S ribosomal protein L13 [Candidatus Saccharibacteria bacterium]QQS70514.1 MAG: 50S ribosomal protein L13 [Candidatus Saccharibacteria bacterium]